MSIPATVQKAFAAVLATRFANVFRGADFDAIGETLDAHKTPICVVCEEADPARDAGRGAWNAAVEVQVISDRDTSIDTADAKADEVFAALGDLEAAIIAKGAELGFQFGALDVGGQAIRQQESVRIIATTYTLKIAALQTL